MTIFDGFLIGLVSGCFATTGSLAALVALSGPRRADLDCLRENPWSARATRPGSDNPMAPTRKEQTPS